MKPWIEECAKLHAMGLSYDLLAGKYGVTRGVIAGQLFRLRRPEKAAYYRARVKLCREAKCDAQFRQLLAHRQEAAGYVFAATPVKNERHKQVLLGFAKGMTGVECGEAGSYSRWGAVLILRRYGLETSERIDKAARERVLGPNWQNAELQISPQIPSDSGGMAISRHVREQPPRASLGPDPEDRG